MEKDLCQNNNSIIKNLFFFALKINYSEDNNENYCINFTLDIDIEQIKKKQVDIYDILNSINVEEYHDNNKPKKIIRKFKFLPDYLIIIIRNNINITIDYKFDEIIDIKPYISYNLKKKGKYELVSLIENNKIIICKSSEDNIWYKYGSRFENIFNYNFKVKKPFLPQLLIYKCIDI